MVYLFVRLSLCHDRESCKNGWTNQVWPVALYGSQSWTLKANDTDNVKAFEMTRYRHMLWISWTEHRTNESVLNEICIGCHSKLHALAIELLKLHIRYNETSFPVRLQRWKWTTIIHTTNTRCMLYIKAGAASMANAWFIHWPVHGLYPGRCGWYMVYMDQFRPVPVSMHVTLINAGTCLLEFPVDFAMHMKIVGRFLQNCYAHEI